MKRRDLKAAPKKESSRTAFHVGALVVLALIVYANSLHGKFVFDDQQLVLQNPQLMNIHAMRDVIQIASGWRQLLMFTYGLNYYLGGLDTVGYHAFNVALHAFNAVLVYFILRAVIQGSWKGGASYPPPAQKNSSRETYAAFAGSSIFCVHTLFTGAVSYVAGRSSVLCATFYFAAVLFFIKALDVEDNKWRSFYLLATAGAAFLAWQTKQEAISLPIFLAALLFLRTEKKDWRWIVPLLAAPAVLVFLMRRQVAALYSAVMGNQVLVAAGFERVLDPAAYFRTYITTVVSYYVPRFVFPMNLSVDPLIPAVERWYSVEFLFSIAVFGGLGWLLLQSYRRQPLLALGVTALFVSPLMAYAAIPLADVVQEHRAYIPGLGVAFLFGWALEKTRWPALLAVVLVFSGMTIARNRVWASNLTLWEDAEQKWPDKPRPHFNLGQAYQEAGRFPEAIREYEHALALKPDIYAAYSNLAAMYLDQQQLDKGEEMLLKVTDLAPDFTEGFINLCVLYLRKQESDKALAAIERAIRLNPDSFAAHFNKGEVLTQKGDFKAALESYKRAVYLRPDLEDFRLSLGVAYSRAGDRSLAEKEFQSLTTSRMAPEAFRNLGVLYSDRGDTEKATSFLEQAIAARPSYPDAHHDLGILYLRRQDPDKAIEHFQATLAQEASYGPAALNLALAFEMKKDVTNARKILESWLERFGNSNSQYVVQARERLAALR